MPPQEPTGGLDQEALIAQLQEALAQPRTPLPALQNLPLGRRLLLGFAGALNPNFQQSVVNPLIQERLNRPELERQFAEAEQQRKLQGIGLLLGLANQQRESAREDTKVGLDQQQEERLQKQQEIDAAFKAGAATRAQEDLALRQGMEDARQERIAAKSAEEQRTSLFGFDLLENSALPLNDEAVSVVEMLRKSGDPDAQLQADVIDTKRAAYLRSINLARDRAFDPGVVRLLQQDEQRLLEEIDDGQKFFGASSGRGVNQTTARRIGVLTSQIGITRKMQDQLQMLVNRMKRSGIAKESLLPDLLQDPEVADFAGEFQLTMSKLRKDLIGTAQSAQEAENTKRALPSGLNMRVRDMEFAIENILMQRVREQLEQYNSLRDSGFDTGGFNSFFSQNSDIVNRDTGLLVGAGDGTEPVPEGIPPGSIRTGEETAEGFDVWRAPDGTLWKDDGIIDR